MGLAPPVSRGSTCFERGQTQVFVVTWAPAAP